MKNPTPRSAKPRSTLRSRKPTARTTPRRTEKHRPAATTRLQAAQAAAAVASAKRTSKKLEVRAKAQPETGPNHRYSGHETFSCRYAWLPKAFKEIVADPNGLAKDESAMIALGVGKNMVRSIRFWLTASGLATGKRDGSYSPTAFGNDLMGADPYLEDVRTLWLLHWTISSNEKEPLFAWDYMLGRWPHHEFTRSEALAAFRRELSRQAQQNKRLSDVTLQQHIDVFVHTYVPTRGHKGEVLEDTLDCPLVELELMRHTGERILPSTSREPIYAFRVEDKPEITPELFAYFVDDFWRRRHPTEKTISVRELALAPGSPGRLLKFPEQVLRERLERLDTDSRGLFSFRSSAALDHVVRDASIPAITVASIYAGTASHA